MQWIEAAIDKLLTTSDGGFNSRLHEVAFDIKIENTNAKGYCYCLKLDGNGNPRTKDLVEFVTERIVDYAIPKKEIDEAKEHLHRTNSVSKILSLKAKASRLFTELKNTGEGGEILLYILVQEILQIPQLLSKMSLKTSGNVHYHGVDGVHVKYDSVHDMLQLFWGESKMYEDINEGITACFKSLNGFLLDTLNYDSTQERDLQLISSNLSQNVNDEELENLLVRFFDRDDNLSNNIQYKGVCFIGFDYDKYPKSHSA